MKKIIKISGKEYTMQSSAYTSFAYKNETGRSLLDDIQKIAKLKGVKDIGVMDSIAETVLKMAFIMAQEADKNQVTNYEDFLKSIDNLYEDIDWINEVIELATFPISRGSIQANKS